MDRDELLQQINKFLDDSPFPDDEVVSWKAKAKKMSLPNLKDLQALLQERLKIITNANQLFTDMADEVLAAEQKEKVTIPKDFDILDMRIEELATMFMGPSLASIIKNENINIIEKLDEYFKESFSVDENAVEQFETLVDSLFKNKESLFKTGTAIDRIAISEWLNFYNQFNDNKDRGIIDRLNFVNNDQRTKGISQAAKKILIKLLSLYDFLLNPETVSAGGNEKTVLQKTGVVYGPPKTETEKSVEKLIEQKKAMQGISSKVVDEEIDNTKKIEDLQIMANRYKDNSLQKRAIEEEIRKLENK